MRKSFIIKQYAVLEDNLFLLEPLMGICYTEKKKTLAPMIQTHGAHMGDTDLNTACVVSRSHSTP